MWRCLLATFFVLIAFSLTGFLATSSARKPGYKSGRVQSDVDIPHVLVDGFDRELALLGYPTTRTSTLLSEAEKGWQGFQVLDTLLKCKSISQDPGEHEQDQASDPVQVLLTQTMPSLFPTVFATLHRIPLPTPSLVLALNGTQPTLDPFLFLAHVDVVPVEDGTEASWQHSPWGDDGLPLVDDEGWIWGRGTLDNKANVAAMLGALEALLRRDSSWRPQRTLLFAFGHDEERGGEGGSAIVARTLPYRRLVGVLDEGGAMVHGMIAGVAAPIALVGVQEKGMMTLRVDVDDPSLSGHSSMPPPVSLITVLTKAVHALEEDQPSPVLSDTPRKMLSTLAGDAAFPLSAVFANVAWMHPLLARLLGARRESASSVRTTVAPTVLHAGTKSNILPRSGYALVNYRVAPGDTIDQVIARGLAAINDDRVRLSLLAGGTGFASNPSPASRTDSDAFHLLYETIGDLCPHCARTPYLVMGGTDARYFHNLSDSVYRFSPVHLTPRDVARIHGTDERIHALDFVSASAFFVRFIARTGRADLRVVPGDQSHLEL